MGLKRSSKMGRRLEAGLDVALVVMRKRVLGVDLNVVWAVVMTMATMKPRKPPISKCAEN